jgi:hypothetical protein
MRIFSAPAMKDLQHRTVSSWSQLCKEINKAKKYLKLDDHEEMWFRGLDRRGHELLPSLFRCLKKQDREVENIRDLENDLFFEFQAKARFTNGLALNDWDILFLMQHYRAPTRLLDWTETLHVAVYFATAYRSRNQSGPARIYAMNPYYWNKEHGYGRDLWSPQNFSWQQYDDHGEDKSDEDEDKFTGAEGEYFDFGEILVDDDYIDWKYPCALYPAQRDVRLSAQRGYFTIHGSDSRPLEEISPECLVAIDLDKEAVKECRKQLDLSGMDEFSLFPDLEGLSRKLRKKYGCP